MSSDQATWEDNFFIKATFPEFYRMTIHEWWPSPAPGGPEASQVGGVC
jgi:hypothetical protein